MLSQFRLLAQKNFAPLFVSNLTGTINDNLFKTALMIMASYGLFHSQPEQAAVLGVAATALFTLPFLLFAGVAGELADRVDRVVILRLVKLMELVILSVAVVGFATSSAPLLLGALFFLGVHSSVFVAVKFAILPGAVRKEELMAASSLMEAGGFIAILIGQALAGLVSPAVAAALTVGLSTIGLLASFMTLRQANQHPLARPNFNPITANLGLVKRARQTPKALRAMLGIAWFYAAGAVLLSELAPITRQILGAGPEVVSVLLALFSVGVALGALASNALLKGEVSSRLVPITSAALAVTLFDLAATLLGYSTPRGHIDLNAFLGSPEAWRVMADVTSLAFVGGVYVAPLTAIVQAESPDHERSRLQAANSLITATVCVAALGLAGLALAMGMSLAVLMLALALISTLVAALNMAAEPASVIKPILHGLFRLAYRVEVTGLENLPADGQGAVIVVNHLSYLDGALIGACLPGKPAFAVHSAIAKAWWMKPVLPLFAAFPVDMTSPLSTRHMIRSVKSGQNLVIFPEGRITVTGALMKVFSGPAMVAEKSGAPIVPVHIEGAQFTPFSLMKGKLHRRLFPKIRITILPAARIETSGSARSRRQAGAKQLYDLMSEAAFASAELNSSIFQALLNARQVHGGSCAILEDVKRAPLSYDKLIIGARLLSAELAEHARPGKAVGLLLPNVNATVVTFFALQARGAVPAMLNYSAGPQHVSDACRASGVSAVITSRAFVEQAKLTACISRLGNEGVTILWLEDIAARIGPASRLLGLVADRTGLVRPIVGKASDVAVILFTSGSEGAPKGVALTHGNLIANTRQVASRIDFNPTDKVLNALPMFHAFGLTGATLLPILNGVRTLLYPNPLHYAAVPALAYDASATILFGSDTFLAGYGRQAQPYDFYSVRYIFAGAERVKPETEALYMKKFGIRLLEGYGATECAPVIAVNTPMHCKAGTVGRLLPGLHVALDPVEGVERGGRLRVKGPNVMAGYYLVSNPGRLQALADGWHDTGDIVEIDSDGFVTIKGRAKRFAKIAGEMVSLGQIESLISELFPLAQSAVMTVPDPRKGERLVLFTTQRDVDGRALSRALRDRGLSELAVPRQIVESTALPMLATGKLDYGTLTGWALDLARPDAA